MQRDYSTLLGRAKTILDADAIGYLDSEELFAKAKIEARFNSDRNKIVRSLLAETASATLASNLALRELNDWQNRLSASGVDFDWKRDWEFVRQSLLDQIEVEQAISPIARVFERFKPVIIFVAMMIPFMTALYYAKTKGWIE
jgi:hypothetical protein